MYIKQKIIDGVKTCSTDELLCKGCPYEGANECVTTLMKDVYNVLRQIEVEQPPTKQSTTTGTSVLQIIIAALDKGDQHIMIESKNGELTLTITPWQKCE